MRIAIASTNNIPESRIYPRAGQAPYYLVFDNGELEEVLDNPYVDNPGGGLGPKIARLLIDKGVDKVVVKQMGSNMRMFLENNNIEVEEVKEDTIKEVLEK